MIGLVCTFSYFLPIGLQEGEQFAQDNGMFYMETSAKTSLNVNELFHEIGELQILSGRNEE